MIENIRPRVLQAPPVDAGSSPGKNGNDVSKERETSVPGDAVRPTLGASAESPPPLDRDDFEELTIRNRQIRAARDRKEREQD